jgi:hypothetical protein
MATILNLRCYTCEKMFQRPIKDFRIGGGNFRTYCSHKCVMVKESHSIICHRCGKIAKRSPSRLKNSKSGLQFCSKRCAAQDNVERQQRWGENHPQYTNGKSCYRNSIGDKCEECGESRYYLLVVHHRNGDRNSNNGDNKITLCWNCHVCRHLVVKDGELVVRWSRLTTDEAREMM